jgi:hypothetical protein
LIVAPRAGLRKRLRGGTAKKRVSGSGVETREACIEMRGAAAALPGHSERLEVKTNRGTKPGAQLERQLAGTGLILPVAPQYCSAMTMCCSAVLRLKKYFEKLLDL